MYFACCANNSAKLLPWVNCNINCKPIIIELLPEIFLTMFNPPLPGLLNVFWLHPVKEIFLFFWNLKKSLQRRNVNRFDIVQLANDCCHCQHYHHNYIRHRRRHTAAATPPSTPPPSLPPPLSSSSSSWSWLTFKKRKYEKNQLKNNNTKIRRNKKTELKCLPNCMNCLGSEAEDRINFTEFLSMLFLLYRVYFRLFVYVK